jgi:hypothetical protein
MLVEMAVTADWIRAAESAGADKDFYLFRRKDFHELLPWDFIDMGVSKEKLWDEYQEALSGNS